MDTWEFKRIAVKVKDGSFRLIGVQVDYIGKINLLAQEAWQIE